MFESKSFQWGRTVAHGIAAVFVFILAMTLPTLWAAPSGGASNALKIHWYVHASTHIKKLNQTVVVPEGSFKGTVNLSSDRFHGTLSLPKATTTIEFAGALPVQATFQMRETKQVEGTITLKTLHVKTTVSVNIFVTDVTIAGTPYNTVGTTCRTSKPIKMTMSGKVHLTGTSTFKGTYTIPTLEDCGLATPVFNQMMAGGGNTFTAKFSSKK